jgi:hypothetical protein
VKGRLKDFELTFQLYGLWELPMSNAREEYLSRWMGDGYIYNERRCLDAANKV